MKTHAQATLLSRLQRERTIRPFSPASPVTEPIKSLRKRVLPSQHLEKELVRKADLNFTCGFASDFRPISWMLRPLCLPWGRVGCNYVTSNRLVSEEREGFSSLSQAQAEGSFQTSHSKNKRDKTPRIYTKYLSLTLPLGWRNAKDSWLELQGFRERKPRSEPKGPRAPTLYDFG